MKKLLLIFGLALLGACTSDVSIVGQGDVRSYPVGYPCSPESTPCVYKTAEAVDETFTATPRSGNLFAGWRNCPSAAGSKCYVKIDQETVEQNYNKTAPGLVAMFAPLDSQAVLVTGCDVGSGLNRSALCAQFWGKTVYLNAIDRNANYPDYLYSSMQVVGFDDRWFHGGYAGLYTVDISDINSDRLVVIGPLSDGSVTIRGDDVYLSGKAR